MAQTRYNPSSGRTKIVDSQQEQSQEFPLGKNNFILMGISLLLIVVGFILTSGSPSGIDQYNPDIFSARRIVVGPTMCFVGFVLMAIAIIVKPKDKKKD